MNDHTLECLGGSTMDAPTISVYTSNVWCLAQRVGSNILRWFVATTTAGGIVQLKVEPQAAIHQVRP